MASSLPPGLTNARRFTAANPSASLPVALTGRRSVVQPAVIAATPVVVAPTPPTIVTDRTSYAWLRGDLGAAPGLTGQGVASWTDQVNGYVFSQGTGSAQPLYTNPDAAINNRPSLQGDGVGMWLENNGGLGTQLAGTDTPFCAYFVLRTSGTIPNAYFCAFESTTTSGARVMTIGTNGTQWSIGRLDDAVNFASQAGGTPAINTTYLVRLRFTGTNITMIANGVTVINNLGLDTGAITIDRCCLFGHRQGSGAAGAFFAGKLSEVYFHSGAASANEAALISYFQGFYPTVS